MSVEQVFGWAATFLFTVCFIPQIITTWKTKTVKGLSFLFLFITFVANVVALVYAILIEQLPLQIKYILAIAFLTLCIALYIHVWIEDRKRIETQKP